MTLFEYDPFCSYLPGMRRPRGTTSFTPMPVQLQLHRSASFSIVALSMERSAAYARRALDVGAIGFLLKDHGETELPAAVRAAARGEVYVSYGGT